jgi:ABC-type nitrate/sulfonate/bicarbonate transport system substrate-binding protein
MASRKRTSGAAMASPRAKDCSIASVGRRQQAVQVQRATGFRAGTRQAFAAERLHADHGTDDVAVDVDVTGVDVVDHLGDGLVDAGVHAQGQAVAGGVDLADQLVDVLALVAHHVQHRAEDLRCSSSKLSSSIRSASRRCRA